MEVHITARHCDVSDTARRRAEERLRRLSRYNGRASAAEVIFSGDHGTCQAEVILRLDGQKNALARGSADNFASALDQAADRIARQLKRRSAQRRRRAASPAAEAGPTAAEPS